MLQVRDLSILLFNTHQENSVGFMISCLTCKPGCCVVAVECPSPNQCGLGSIPGSYLQGVLSSILLILVAGWPQSAIITYSPLWICYVFCADFFFSFFLPPLFRLRFLNWLGGFTSNFHSLLALGRHRSERNISVIGNPIWPPGGHFG